MSTEAWKLEKDLCRCCHAEGSFHNLAEPRYKLGEEEVYSEMLRYSFDVNLSPVTGLLCSMTFTICESCILRLRDATNFKRQVLMCEDRFKDMYSNVMKALNPGLHPTFEVKVESSNVVTQEEIKEEYLQLSDNDDTFDVEMSVDEDDDDDDKTVLQVKLDNAKKAKAKAKAKPKPKVKILPEKKTVRPKKKTEKTETAAKAEDKPKKDGDFTVVKTDGVKKYLCNLCGVEVSSRYSIKQHVATRHRELKCPLCEKLFSKSREQKLHVRLEHGMEMTGKNLRQSAKHTCHICNKDFPVKSSLHRHNHYKHKLKQCPDCTGMFTVKQLPKHRCEVHGVELPTCGVCGYKNPNEHLVVQHQRKVHLKEKNVSCPHCELKFYDVHYLNRHIVSHGTEVLYECSYCYKKFPRKTTMRMHEKIHKGEKNKVCAVCGDRFVQKASLNYHMTKHHPEAC